MKTKTFIFILISIPLIWSCKKDDDDDTLNAEIPFRIKKVTETYNGNTGKKYDFTYNGENLVKYEVHWYTGLNWKEYSIQDITYNGSIATLIEHSEDTNVGKTDYTINNNFTSEFLSYNYFNTQWIKSYKRTYKYTGSNLTEYMTQLFVDGAIQNTDKGIFLYDNNQIKRIIIYTSGQNNDWLVFRKDTFIYSNNNLASYVNYYRSASSWVSDMKVDYTYQGENVSEAKVYRQLWNGGSASWTLAETRKYQYDSNGLLTKENIVSEHDNLEYVYEYEAGKGNASKFYANPEQLVYKTSLFRSGPNF